ncbi:MAG: hypothetical protein ABSB89_10735 [Candidatus Bathyarchaeia archaeon]|jgi:hypothetical protein
MIKKRFVLVASVDTESPEAVQPVLERLFKKGCLTRVGDNKFQIEAELEGENAKALNRSLLSDLRRAERKTRLRAEWKTDTATERYFDYVLKKTSKA